jgi:hypothetical protein
VAQPFGLGEARSFDLGALAAGMGATFSLGELRSVDVARRLAYASPGGVSPYETLVVPCGWGLPEYELALMTSTWLADRAIDADVTLVTPESAPLQLFGRDASDVVATLLEKSGGTLYTGAYAAEAHSGELLLVGGNIVVADHVVALPRLEGPRIGGIPQTFEGFVPWTSMAESRVRMTSTPPATSRRSPSSRVASPPNRSRRRPSRSRRRPVSTSSRGRSGAPGTAADRVGTLVPPLRAPR